MSQTHNFFILVLLLRLLSAAGALYGHAVVRCHFNSPDGHDAVYLEQYYFNKRLLYQYNSTLGKIIGYTEKARKTAEILNKSPSFVNAEIWRTEHCKRDAPLLYNDFLKPVEPHVRLRSVEAGSSKHPAMLVCSVYDFYPKRIRVTWLKDGKEATSDVTSTDQLSNGNWLYQIHSHLVYTPRPGEKITCMVEHASLIQPRLYDWEPMPCTWRSKVGVGTAGVLLGLLFLVAGLIYYKKNSAVQVLVPTAEVFYPEQTL